MEHSILAPSNAGVWVKCPGSIKVTPHGLTQDPDSGLEGEASHFIASQQLLHPGQSPVLGAQSPEGTIITEEMAEAAEVYVQDVESVGLAKGVQNLGGVEQRVTAPTIHKEVFGTVDAWTFHPHTRTLYVWDYKYGWGLVEAFENWQLVCYAVGLLDMLRQARGVVDLDVTVKMRVAQPRPYHAEGPVREWSINGGDLRAYANLLAHAAAAALGPDPDITSGKQCRYCLGRSVCPVAREAALHAVDLTEKAAVLDLPVEAVGNEYAVLLRAQKAIEYRVTGLAAQLTAQIKDGKAVPGWCLEPGRGKKVWKVPPEKVLALGKAFGADFEKPADTITPSQAKKMKGVDAGMVEAYTRSEDGAKKLTPFDKTLAAKAFKPQKTKE